MKIDLVIRSEEQMLALGSALADALAGHGAVHINGQLGAGKTTLSRGILRGMGHTGSVKSPTFTLVEPYTIGEGQVFHFDLYRLVEPDELEYIGVDDYFAADSLCLIEWPEKASGFLPEHDLDIGIDVSGETRNIHIWGRTAHGNRVCEALKKQYS